MKSVYQLAWEALTGRTDEWGGCANSAEVEAVATSIMEARRSAGRDPHTAELQ